MVVGTHIIVMVSPQMLKGIIGSRQNGVRMRAQALFRELKGIGFLI
jgi:hypothetical protein